MQEIPLTGGRVTSGIVHVGDTVRRPPCANAPFVHRLLRQLETAGFDGAPRFMGMDPEGREILTFVPGSVPTELGWHGDHVLASAARLIRRFHDAGAGLPELHHGTIACHNDLSPCNAVFREGLPVALIDFDAAGPGTRAQDLGYAAWLWLDLGDIAIAPPEQRRRLQLFLAAYGTGPDRVAILAALRAHQTRLARAGMDAGNHALAAWARASCAWTDRHLADSS